MYNFVGGSCTTSLVVPLSVTEPKFIFPLSPGDAMCMSVILNEPFWELYDGRKSASCLTVDQWKQTCNNPDSENVFSDPLYDAMSWSYRMIDVERAWQGRFSGYGVHIRINDDGVDASHPEFHGRFDVNNSCPEYLPRDYEVDTHGTACASIIAAAPDNEQCAVGIAHGATIVSVDYE